MRKIGLYLVYFLYILFAVTHFSIAQEVGRPFVKAYLPKEYKAATQNWAIEQDQYGVMYFGNSEGVLRFNGASWQLIPVSNQSVVRSLAMDNNGIIYVGARNEFGYLMPFPDGNLKYVSLSKQLPKEEQSFNDTWQTVATREGVYFRTINRVFRWYKGKLSIIKPQTRVTQLEYVHSRLFLKQSALALSEIKGDEIVPIDGLDALEKDITPLIVPYIEDKVLFYNSKSSFQVWSPREKSLTKLPTQADSFLVRNGVYDMFRQPNGTYILCTRKGGSVIMNDKGVIVKRMGRNEGLHNFTHYYAKTDKQDGIWIGTNNGIIHVEANSPLSYFNEARGLEGSIYSMIRYESKLYVGTSLGLYVLDEKTGTFLLVEPLSQVWGLKQYTFQGQKKLIVSASSGIYELKNNKVVPIVDTPVPSFCTYLSKRTPNVIYSGGNNLLSAYAFKNNKWERVGLLQFKGDEIRSLHEDSYGNLWGATTLSGIYKISYNKVLDSTASITKYDTLKGLPLRNNSIYVLADGDWVIGTEKGLKKYHPDKDRFVHDTRLGKEFADSVHISRLYEDRQRNIWLFVKYQDGRKELGVAVKGGDSNYEWDATPYRRLPEMNEITINGDANGVMWFGGSDGLFRFDTKVSKNYLDKPQLLISRVLVGEDKDSVLFGGVFSKDFKRPETGEVLKIVSLNQTKDQVPLVHYDYNSMMFEFALASFDETSSNQYSHILEGYDEHWSSWSTETKKEYTNLFEGQYTFKVKSRNIYGIESDEVIYKFNVLPPWYRSAWAYIAYVILISLSVYLLILLFTYRLKRQNEKLEALVAERTAELAQRNEEILAQAENLREAHASISLQNAEINRQKTQIEQSYNNVRVLSEIGQKITSTLDLQEISRMVYSNVNSLMDASGFGLGVYNRKKNAIDFNGFVEKGEILPDHYEYIDNDNPSLAVVCLTQRQEIVINDYKHEYIHYTKKKANDNNVGELPHSIIYLPLMVEDRAVGVITVQSFKVNAYDESNLTILRTLASYVAIAIDNANSYHIIEEKNKHITDSIRYARTIQQATLPGRKRMAEALKDYFVIFRPKDIVSGDFYWITHIKEENEETGQKIDKVFVAVADCTGHGVPGGFMSMIGNNLLNEIIKMQHVYDTAKILELLDEGVVHALRQDEKDNDDGMDIMLCCIEYTDPQNVIMGVSGAKTSMFYVKQGETRINDIRGDNRLIGGMKHKSRPFTRKELYLQVGDMIYLSSDGFGDQNNPEGLKFGKERLRNTFAEISVMSTYEQKKYLETALDYHQQNVEQRDDITVVGIRL